MGEIPEVDTVESLTGRAKADMVKMNAQLARAEVWNAPSDEQHVWRMPADDGSGEVEVRPVTVTPAIVAPSAPSDAAARIAALLPTAEPQTQYLIHLGYDILVCPGETEVAHQHLQQLRRQVVDEHLQATGRQPDRVPWLIGVYPPHSVGGPQGKGGVFSYGYSPTIWGHIDLPRDQWLRVAPPLPGQA